MTQQTYPRSPKALLGGITHLGRFIDKIRLRHEGAIQDYNYITVGFGKYLVDFLQIAPKVAAQFVSLLRRKWTIFHHHGLCA